MAILKLMVQHHIWITPLVKYFDYICLIKTKRTSMTMWLSLKWLSILQSIQAFRKHLLESSKVKTFHYQLICFYPENLTSTPRPISSLERCNSLLKKLNVQYMMLNKIENTFMTASIKPSHLLLVIWLSYQPRTSNHQAFTSCNHGLWAPFE